MIFPTEVTFPEGLLAIVRVDGKLLDDFLDLEEIKSNIKIIALIDSSCYIDPRMYSSPQKIAAEFFSIFGGEKEGYLEILERLKYRDIFTELNDNHYIIFFEA